MGFIYFHCDSIKSHFYSMFQSAANQKQSKSSNQINRDIMTGDKKNPFTPVNHWTFFEILCIITFGPTLITIRIILLTLLMIPASIFARVFLLGYVPKKHTSDGFDEPLPLWRRRLAIYVVKPIFRVILFVLGFYWIPVKGTVESKERAPIFVSNHISAFDGFVLGYYLDCSPTIRHESEQNPILGPLYRIIQSIFVHRNNKDSRKAVAKEICYRATHLGYPQLLIFPEAATTNGKTLIVFKGGAFYPGETIQPIILRCNDNLKWTPGRKEWEIFLRTLAQPINSISIEFLDPYVPTEKEKRYPELYCENVRSYMAGILKSSPSDLSSQDALLLHEARFLNQNFNIDDVCVSEMTCKYKCKFEDGNNDFMDSLNMFLKMDLDKNSKVSFEEFGKFLTENSRLETEAIKTIWHCINPKDSKELAFKEFMIGVYVGPC
jgi:lysophosphatidylcholine acyltransferase/lyso-PAF acetyltransferase